MSAEKFPIDESRVTGASSLLDYAIEKGFQIDEDIIRPIREMQLLMEAYLQQDVWHETETHPANPEPSPVDPKPSPADQIVSFDEAVLSLSRLTTPVTAQTLYDTRKTDAGGLVLFHLGEASRSRRWSWKLWYLTFAVLLFIVCGQILEMYMLKFLPADYADQFPDETTNFLGIQLKLLSLEIVNEISLVLIPFLYGALGACTYLLKTCHKFSHERSFDRNRTPEYFSRILLGVVSGGAVMLFAEQIINDGAVINLSSAALAFIVGYNSDYLFEMIERVASAIMPKIGLDSVKRQPQRAVPVKAASVEELVTLMDKATNPETRKAIKALLDRIFPP